MQRHHLERVLFVVGNRHCGKSTQLRGMFKDVRLGTGGGIPKDRKLADFHSLTNDRFLCLRLSSPHELKETPREFLKKTENKIKAANSELGTRWNFARVTSTVRAARPCKGKKVTQNLVSDVTENGSGSKGLNVV